MERYTCGPKLREKVLHCQSYIICVWISWLVQQACSSVLPKKIMGGMGSAVSLRRQFSCHCHYSHPVIHLPLCSLTLPLPHVTEFCLPFATRASTGLTGESQPTILACAAKRIPREASKFSCHVAALHHLQPRSALHCHLLKIYKVHCHHPTSCLVRKNCSYTD